MPFQGLDSYLYGQIFKCTHSYILADLSELYFQRDMKEQYTSPGSFCQVAYHNLFFKVKSVQIKFILG